MKRKKCTSTTVRCLSIFRDSLTTDIKPRNGNGFGGLGSLKHDPMPLSLRILGFVRQTRRNAVSLQSFLDSLLPRSRERKHNLVGEVNLLFVNLLNTTQIEFTRPKKLIIAYPKDTSILHAKFNLPTQKYSRSGGRHEGVLGITHKIIT